ncbi:MAG: hypothetical protein ACLFSR_03560 [Halomonas sp.]
MPLSICKPVAIICLCLMSMPVLAQEATPEVEIESLTIMRPATPQDDHAAHTMIEVLVWAPQVADLGEGSRVSRLEDDQGTDLLSSTGDPQEAFGFVPEEVGYILDHQVEGDLEEGWLRFPVFAPRTPDREASEIRLEADLNLMLATDGEREVQVADVDLSEIPGWGLDLEVEDVTVTCRDERRTIPEDAPLELFCFSRDVALLGVEVIGQEDTPEADHPEANLVVAGETDAVNLAFRFPEVEEQRLQVSRVFGLGLQAR